MKTYLATGTCLIFGLLLARADAEELKWRRVTSSPTDAEPIPVMLSEPVLLQSSGYSGDGSTQFRQTSLRFGSSDDDTVPRPLPSSGQTPMAVTGQPTLIFPPSSQPNMPQGSDEVIPFKPRQHFEDGSQENGTFVTSSPCNCGSGGGVVQGEGDGCCSCCIPGGGWGCGLGMGWLPNLLDHLRGPGILNGCCASTTCCTDACAVGGCCMSGGCLDGCCMDGCCYNGNRNHMWLTGEYLLWTFSRPNLPPLVTTGSAGTVIPGTAVTTGPALGQNGTSTVIGNDNFGNDTHSGMRFNFGFWIPNCENLGLEFGFLYFPQNSTTVAAGNGILGRPFFDVTPGNGFQNTQAVNGYNNTTGSASVTYNSQIWGLDANLRWKLYCCPNFKIDLLAGYRNFNLNESVSINENLSVGGVPTLVADNYSAQNSFNGGQIGLDAEWRFWSRWSLGAKVMVAFGDVHQSVSISGAQNVAGFPIGIGQFATSNIGNYSRDQFAVLPEGTVRLGFDITNNVRFFVGYNVLYLSNAARVGDAIDTTLNSNKGVFGTGAGPNRPAFVFTNGNFLAQGANFGLDIHY